MRRGQPTRLGAVLLVIVAITVVVCGVVWVGQLLLGGGSNPREVSAGQKLLNEPNEQVAVRMSTRGPVNANENHYSIVMTISANQRRITTYHGYDGSVIHDEQLSNTKIAFDDFLAALNRAGFMRENPTEEPHQGICATGQLIFFEVFEYVRDEQGNVSEKSATKLWTTTCDKLNGNFAGLLNNVINLFKAQIPGSQTIIDNAKKEVRNSVYRDNYDTGLGSVR
ncbi:hypothetical protein FWC31_03990 [Candidatus Saccharibacteria bacterium]|nr:hypothetical protein [Candidatus Saccharibacteria bacterium]